MIIKGCKKVVNYNPAKNLVYMRRAFPAAKRTELIPSIYNVRKSRQQDGNREIKFF